MRFCSCDREPHLSRIGLTSILKTLIRDGGGCYGTGRAGQGKFCRSGDCVCDRCTGNRRLYMVGGVRSHSSQPRSREAASQRRDDVETDQPVDRRSIGAVSASISATSGALRQSVGMKLRPLTSGGKTAAGSGSCGRGCVVPFGYSISAPSSGWGSSGQYGTSMARRGTTKSLSTRVFEYHYDPYAPWPSLPLVRLSTPAGYAVASTGCCGHLARSGLGRVTDRGFMNDTSSALTSGRARSPWG